MTLDEAIAKYEQLINRFEPLAIYLGKNETLDETRQLVSWLAELKDLRTFRDDMLAILLDEEVDE